MPTCIFSYKDRILEYENPYSRMGLGSECFAQCYLHDQLQMAFTLKTKTDFLTVPIVTSNYGKKSRFHFKIKLLTLSEN